MSNNFNRSRAAALNLYHLKTNLLEVSIAQRR